jgi:cytochrome P450
LFSIKQFPWLLTMLKQLPDWWVKATNDAVYLIRVQEAEYLEMARGVINGGEDDKSSHVTVFHDILNEPNLPPTQKTEQRMMAEAESIVGAGTLTSAHMLSLTSYFVLENPRILETLSAELREAMPDASSSPTMQVFESLPYLNAVINEGLRMSYGSMHRLSRSHPSDSLQYGDWVIPPGTPVGYSAYFLHNNSKLFPNPQEFNPERWTRLEPSERQRLRSHLNMFGRGTRQCAGMRLAYAEIYLTLGYLFRRLGQCMQLHDTEYARDIKFVQDFFIPAPSSQSKGCRVMARA